METEILYEEIQKFNKGLLLFLQLITGALLITATTFLIFGVDMKEVGLAVLSASVICILISLAFTHSKLITQIRTDGIYVSFPPFQTSFTKCKWENISRLYIRKYNPLKEYGGWGIRFGYKGRAYNISGNIGIQIVFTDNSQLLIGTNEADDIADILIRLGKLDAQLQP
jgi:hypothetical protein